MITYSYEILVFISSWYQEEIFLLITPTTVYIIATDLNFSHHWYNPTVNIAISSGNNANNSFQVGDYVTVTPGTAERCCWPPLNKRAFLTGRKGGDIALEWNLQIPLRGKLGDERLGKLEKLTKETSTPAPLYVHNCRLLKVFLVAVILFVENFFSIYSTVNKNYIVIVRANSLEL